MEDIKVCHITISIDQDQIVYNVFDPMKNDESIPLRSNKKTGAKSKKEVREQVRHPTLHRFHSYQ